ncbi:MAG: hypothetical protein GY812_10745, partial [Actinomycetia bacterium]|nr:hypothetical protein [Actinomycetes bacterium]
ATGQLLGNPWIVTRESDDPIGDFARAVAVGTAGTADEAGLAAAVAALGEPLASGANRGFRRADAVLHVVVVSDADDHSDTLLDDPSAAVAEVLAEATTQSGLPAMLSAVVGDEGTGCSGEYGDAAPGDTYNITAAGTDTFELDERPHGEARSAVRRLMVINDTDFTEILRNQLASVRRSAIRLESMQREAQDRARAGGLRVSDEQGRIGERISIANEA